jgi:hypothetical protein
MQTDSQPENNTSALTDEQRARMDEWLRDHPYGDQDENGIDVGAIRRNLALTPGQRLDRLQQAVDSMRKVTDAAASD